MKEISFEATREEHDIIRKIAERAHKMAAENGVKYPLHDAVMDVTAAHANGAKLKLQELLEADDFNFAHDVFGIWQHIDRTTGELMDCFWPRFAA